MSRYAVWVCTFLILWICKSIGKMWTKIVADMRLRTLKKSGFRNSLLRASICLSGQLSYLWKPCLAWPQSTIRKIMNKHFFDWNPNKSELFLFRFYFDLIRETTKNCRGVSAFRTCSRTNRTKPCKSNKKSKWTEKCILPISLFPNRQSVPASEKQIKTLNKDENLF